MCGWQVLSLHGLGAHRHGGLKGLARGQSSGIGVAIPVVDSSVGVVRQSVAGMEWPAQVEQHLRENRYAKLMKMTTPCAPRQRSWPEFRGADPTLLFSDRLD